MQGNAHLNTQVNHNNVQVHPHHSLNVQTHPSVPQVHNTVSGQEISFGNPGYSHG